MTCSLSRTLTLLAGTGIAAALLGLWPSGSRVAVRTSAEFHRASRPVHEAPVPSSNREYIVGNPTGHANAARDDGVPRRSAVDAALGELDEEIRRAIVIADPDERRDVLVGACLRWADFDPADALHLAYALGLDQGPSAVFDDIIQKWARADFTTAFSWAESRPPGSSRDGLMARLAFVRSQTRPDEAAILALGKIPPGPAQTEAIISVLHQWALRDFAGAQAWVDRFPPGMRNRASGELAVIANARPTRGAVSR